MSDEKTDSVNESSDEASPRRRGKPVGCVTMLLLGGLALLAGGVYLMNQWDQLQGPGKTGAVMLVVLGTFLLLPFVVFLIGWVVLRIFLGKLSKSIKAATDEMAQAAGAMVAGNKAMYGKIHEFRAANDEDFESADRAAYDRVQQELESRGYRLLGDIVDQTIEEVSSVTAVIRVMASTDGTSTAGFYDMRGIMPQANIPAGVLIMDIGSEFNDGTFFISSNTEGLDLTTTATGISRRHYRPGTPVIELARLHEAQVQQLLAAKEGAQCVVIHTLADAIEAEKRQQAVKNAFRENIGYLDPEEVRRVARGQEGVEDVEGFANLTAEAAEKARRAEQRQG